MMGVIYLNELQVFNNPEFGEVRSIQIDGEPWFVGKDVAAALGYENTRDALVKHVDEEDKGGSEMRHPWWPTGYDYYQ